MAENLSHPQECQHGNREMFLSTGHNTGFYCSWSLCSTPLPQHQLITQSSSQTCAWILPLCGTSALNVIHQKAPKQRPLYTWYEVFSNAVCVIQFETWINTKVYITQFITVALSWGFSFIKMQTAFLRVTLSSPVVLCLKSSHETQTVYDWPAIIWCWRIWADVLRTMNCVILRILYGSAFPHISYELWRLFNIVGELCGNKAFFVHIHVLWRIL